MKFMLAPVPFWTEVTNAVLNAQLLKYSPTDPPHVSIFLGWDIGLAFFL
jgi:hypothetical protein